MNSLVSRLMPAHASLVQELECARAVDVQGLQDRIAEFQRTRFSGQTLQGKLTHLQREVKELQASPGDSMEWADVVILLLGAAEMRGMSVADLVDAARIKMGINERRSWGPPDAEGCCSHVEEGFSRQDAETQSRNH